MPMFAYHQLILAIKNRANKKDAVVCEMNPTYISQIGKIKYKKQLGISIIHPAASYVIAGRVIGFKGKLPPVLNSLHRRRWQVYLIGCNRSGQYTYLTYIPIVCIR